MNHAIRILEVGPRDGLQTLPVVLPTNSKKKLITGLIEAGLTWMELTSFVNPNKVPQLSDAFEITQWAMNEYPGVNFIALIPNFYGAEFAAQAGIKLLTYVISVDQKHNLANTNQTLDESFRALARVMHTFSDSELNISIATAFGTKSADDFGTYDLRQIVKRLYQMGIRSFTLADTFGVANRSRVKKVLQEVVMEYGNCDWQVHFHGSPLQTISNTLFAISQGIQTVHTSIRGLGGCPFISSPQGNTPLEQLNIALQEMGYETGIDQIKLELVGRELGVFLVSHVFV